MEFTLQPPHSEQLSFSGHETFVLRCGWLKKAYDAVVADPWVLGRNDVFVPLVVGKTWSVQYDIGLSRRVSSKRSRTQGVCGFARHSLGIFFLALPAEISTLK